MCNICSQPIEPVLFAAVSEQVILAVQTTDPGAVEQPGNKYNAVRRELLRSEVLSENVHGYSGKALFRSGASTGQVTNTFCAVRFCMFLVVVRGDGGRVRTWTWAVALMHYRSCGALAGAAWRRAAIARRGKHC